MFECLANLNQNSLQIVCVYIQYKKIRKVVMKKISIFIVYMLTTCFTCVLLSGLEQFWQPHFSIIVSSYNYGHFLPDTIESVLSQKYKYWELILVNDGSTDNTLTVMQEYAKKDKRIKILNQKNQGLSIARNNAMKIANGDYYWFVDADDFIDKDALVQLSRKIKKTEYPDIVSFWIQPIDVYKNKLAKGFYEKLPSEFSHKENEVFLGRDLSFSILYYYPVTSGKQVYKRTFLQYNDIQFIPKLIFEDDVFFMTSLQANARGTTIRKALYYKRSHSKSIVANKGKHYASVIKLPMYIYSESKRIGGKEEILRELFKYYFDGVFVKYPNDKKYLPNLKALADWINKQTQDDFWQSNYKRITDFIRQQEEN